MENRCESMVSGVLLREGLLLPFRSSTLLPCGWCVSTGALIYLHAQHPPIYLINKKHLLSNLPPPPQLQPPNTTLANLNSSIRNLIRIPIPAHLHMIKREQSATPSPPSATRLHSPG